jgi:hypothetical protein
MTAFIFKVSKVQRFMRARVLCNMYLNPLRCIPRSLPRISHTDEPRNVVPDRRQQENTPGFSVRHGMTA